MTSSDIKHHISVADFYKGKCIFVTGATGFLGKILVEKLLWTCPGIERIYLLIRPKKNEDAISRLTTVLGTRVFDRLRNQRPNDLKKVTPISGDLSQPYLNISQKDEDILSGVSVVFHLAATVQFNVPLKQAVTINTTATKNLAEFCEKMTNIKAFVHVSTAYCNCDREEVKEEIYSVSHDPESIIRLVEIMDGDIIDAVAPKLLGKRPNTYTYTKALAENVLQEYKEKLPIIIVRPSIVLSSIKEPVPGWIDTWNGPTSFIAAGAHGLLHGALVDGRKVVDIIPADMVVNLTICSAWRTVMQSGNPNIEVYNCCSGERNPITWKEFLDYGDASGRRNPPEKLITYPIFIFQRHRSTRYIQKLFMEELPAFIIDVVYNLAGKKSILLKTHSKLVKANEAMAFASLSQWRFPDQNMQHLWNMLEKEDRLLFPFDVSDIHWPTFVETYFLGIRHYLLKNNPNSVADSRKQLEKLKWINVYVPCLLTITAVLCYIIFNL